MRARRLLCCLLLLAGCPSSTSTPSGFYDQAVGGLCQYLTRCGAYGNSELDQCKSAESAAFSDEQKYYNIDDAVNQGRIKYNQDEANKCIDAVNALHCNGGLGILTNGSSACDNVVVGLVPMGGTCYSSSECASGDCSNSTTGCAGTCQGGTNNTCTSKSCASGSYCNGFACVPKVASGGTCTSLFSTQCQDNLVCTPSASYSSYTCLPLPGSGQPCSPLTGCTDGLYCDGTTHPASPVCAAQADNGSSCIQSNACKDGFVCISGTCAAFLDAGSKCTPSNFTGCPSDMTCANGVCKTNGVGTDCTGSQVSCSFGYCDQTTGRCAEKVGYGEKCNPLAGSSCLSASCNTQTDTCSLQCQ